MTETEMAEMEMTAEAAAAAATVTVREGHAPAAAPGPAALGGVTVRLTDGDGRQAHIHRQADCVDSRVTVNAAARHAAGRRTMRRHQHRHPTALLAGALLLLSALTAAPAAAQPEPGAPTDPGRVFLAVNGGLQTVTRDFTDALVFTGPGQVPYGDRLPLSSAAAGETARADSAYAVEPGVLFDVSGAVRVWRGFALGAAATRFTREDPASVSAAVPHPFFFRRDRAIAGTSPPLTREETAVHLQALWVLPATRALTVTFFGGPTAVELQQDLVQDVIVSQAYPYDTASFTSAETGPQSARAIGFNVGADVAYYFAPTIGVGWLTRFSRAMVDVPSADGDQLNIEVGGLHAAVGLRFRF